MKCNIELLVLCFLVNCNKSYPEQLEQEEVIGANGTNASFSLNYLNSDFKTKKLEQPIVISEDVLQTAETPVPSIPHSLITNGVLSSDGLSETGQVPVVVTLLDSGSGDLTQSASHVLQHDLELIKNKTRSLPKLTVPPHNDSATLLSEPGDNVLSTALPVASQPVPPPGGENSTAGAGQRANESTVQTPSSEDIPSFREWTQKQLAEAEKKKGECEQKNYASPDCGAKIVGSNAEAKSPNSVLSPSRDEYILSPCTSKIWFAVELCESIQAKKIELANFELFSSSPREFTVSVADRWPTKDWTIVGQLTAKDERTIQSFPLTHSLFAKYVKLEFHSHYGSEHFCPVSLLRVFGTSELDVLDSDAHDMNDIEVDDEVDETEGGDAANNIFGSARDAVISIVKKAAEVLTPQQAKNQSDPTSPHTSDTVAPSGNNLNLVPASPCSSPAHIIVCDNCTDDMFHAVYNVLACHRKYIETLFASSFIARVLRTSPMCASYGLDVLSAVSGIKPNGVRRTCQVEFDEEVRLVISFLGAHQVAALCNHLAIVENKVVLNITQAEPVLPSPSDLKPITPGLHTSPSSANLDSLTEDNLHTEPLSTPASPQFCTIESSLIAFPRTSGQVHEATTLANLASRMLTTPERELYRNSADIVSQIRPTKTLDLDGPGFEQRPVGYKVEGTSTTMMGGETREGAVHQEREEGVINSAGDPKPPAILDDPPHPEKDSSSLPSFDLPSSPPPPPSGEEDKDREREGSVGKEREGGVESLETLFSELEAVGDTTQQPTSAQHSPPPQQLKESVLMRLANRIKSLERNMSLSGQYLDELSRRYKRQIEELSRALAEALAERKRGEVREAKLSYELSVLAQQLASLTVSVDTILTERESWLYKLLIFVAVLFVCRVLPEVELSQRKISLAWRRGKLEPSVAQPVRRKSDSILHHNGDAVEPRKRRPSEEAMKSSGSTHCDLVIPPSTTSVEIPSSHHSISTTLLRPLTKSEKRRKRRKKEVKLKISSSFNTLSNTRDSYSQLKRTSSSDHIRWCDQVNENLTVRNSFEPLSSPLQSPENSPPHHEGIFSTAMSARSKRSIVPAMAPPKLSDTDTSVVSFITSHQGDSRSYSNSSSTTGTPKKSSGFKKYVKKFF
ncbi:hypothetical protein M8J75_003954 [Diaphorina citri]|nr:hypothetical protein M8J75_003954 [Diaphorina citri]